MASLSGAISSMVALLLIAVLGFIVAKLGYLNSGNCDDISKLVLNGTLPCTIVASVANMDAAVGAEQIIVAFVLAAIAFPTMLAAGGLCVVALRVPKGQRHLYVFMSMFTNVGFIGITVASAVYGGSSAFIASIFVAVINLLFYSIGVQILTGGQRFDAKALVNAPLVASAVAIAMFFSGLQLPPGIDMAVSMVGSATAPLAMMLVGLSVAQSSLRSLVAEWRMYAFVLIRFLLFPALLFLVARMFVTDPIVLGVFVVMLAMPVGSMASAIASVWGQDPVLPAKGTIITTLASFVTIPALFAFMALV